MSVVEDYLKNTKEPNKSELIRIRDIVSKNYPDATEVITYGMPGFKYKGKYLVAFAAFKNHLSLFPGAHAIEENIKDLGDYKISKGTLQFTIEKPLTEKQILDILKVRIRDINTND